MESRKKGQWELVLMKLKGLSKSASSQGLRCHLLLMLESEGIH